ncbi:unnamed protein product [Fraxinus pennsylvanica]|uniref:J domain-containing protein n=1 Tax=Fraxinus pennsylvanica TaxID=56036 RepID=A0AAD2E010_9LAMI|nr:unnamed protein product [Fraxinus pennsylvanica]
MLRKRNQQKNGLDRCFSNGKKGISDCGPAVQNTEGRINDNEMKDTQGVELPNSNPSVMPQTKSRNDTSHMQDEKKSKKKPKKSHRRENKSMDAAHSEKPAPEEGKTDMPTVEVSDVREKIEIAPESTFSSPNSTTFADSQNELLAEDRMGNVEFTDTKIFKWMRTCALAISKASIEWVERHKPMFVALKTNALKIHNYVRRMIEHVQPIVFRWIVYFGNTILLLLMVWLDCAIRGVESLLRMGTTSVFSIIWFGVLSTVAMVGMTKFLIILAITAVIGLFAGFALASVFIFFAGATFLWLYGSFWTTGLTITLAAGLAFILSHDRIALFITTVYSMYCAWTYVGWLGVLVGLNLSFISSDVLLYVLRNTLEQRRPDIHAEQAAGMQGEPSFFSHESMHASSSGIGTDVPDDRNPGIPSTSKSDSEMTSEDEVVRLLNCKDHYSALGLFRFQNVDVSVIKREYRKKAMLVHPDKNMGNEKAAEAFKKLQNAYEVLLDSIKRKEYDDELKREELLNFFRNIQNGSQENKGRGFATSSFARPEADGEDPLGELRRIACRKCGYFHVWVHTKKPKSRARWCQDCKDFHQAKDGDGWVEQSSQPLFFGILQKVEPPAAYVCADGKIYDATEWYICQGMRCPVNTHKPSFHVNTSVMSKNSNGKGSNSGQSRGGIPTHNMEETMTEEEFFEWLQNAMQSGAFENFAGSTSTSENPPNRNVPKTGGGNSSSAGSKRKKKGKKQWKLVMKFITCGMAREQAAGMQGQPSFFSHDPMHATSSGIGADIPDARNPGEPSTCGSDSEVTSEDEVVRLLNCKDHYSALGLSRFQNVDASVIKREYRKKAMLVHPDKNMGNEKAAEAFKKLQNAYEVLLDSVKRKEYDDELKREELLNFFRNIQNGSQENKGRGFAASSFARTEADGEDPLGELRRIACRKCSYFHIWVHTNKPKSRARWCQECKDFHQARDGDGWVEQSSQPLFFGILQKVEPPAAYVCADGKIYDATEWYICQGMRCPANTHKPSFHVNTSVMSKNSNGKGSSPGQSRGGIPTHTMEDAMTEEEFFEWLQNAMQSGTFENFAAGGSTSENPPTRNAPKTGGSNSSSAGSKRKKKGKKQCILPKFCL